MATLPNQNNNKGRIQPMRKIFNKNAIQTKPHYKNDSNQELYELLHTNVTYEKEKEKGDTYLGETWHGRCDTYETSWRCHISKIMTSKICFMHYITINYLPLILNNSIQVKECTNIS